MTTVNISVLPLELLQLIAVSLPTVEDVLSFASASHRLYDAVHSDQQVPRSHFLRLYEPPRKAGFYDYWRALRWRRVLTPEVVADLFLDAVPTRALPLAPATSKNLALIPATYLEHLPPALQLELYPLSFGLPPPTMAVLARLQDVHACFKVCWFCPPEPRAQLVEIAALFRHHLTHARGVHYQGIMLALGELPSFWTGGYRIDEMARAPIPTRWFGAYSYIVAPQVALENGSVLPETGDNVLSDLLLSFPPSLPPDAAEIPFSGKGNDINPFTIREGLITLLPEGRKYVSFKKDYGYHCWQYDGVMVAGKNLVLGVWRLPELAPENVYMSQHGVFMWWAVPKEAVTPEYSSTMGW